MEKEGKKWKEKDQVSHDISHPGSILMLEVAEMRQISGGRARSALR